MEGIQVVYNIMHAIHLILCDIRSAHNVGSILRTADAGGITQVHLCGVTPAPIDRFGRKRSDIAKVALGAENTVRWTQDGDVLKTINRLKQEGVAVIAIEQHPQSVPYYSYTNTTPVAFVVGEETNGLTDEVLSACDGIVEIPMKGEKESLNVAVATGIVLFRYIEQSS